MYLYKILTTVKRLGLRPRRTMRLVMWTAEEIGIIGGHAYWDAHKVSSLFRSHTFDMNPIIWNFICRRLYSGYVGMMGYVRSKRNENGLNSS